MRIKKNLKVLGTRKAVVLKYNFLSPQPYCYIYIIRYGSQVQCHNSSELLLRLKAKALVRGELTVSGSFIRFVVATRLMQHVAQNFITTLIVVESTVLVNVCQYICSPFRHCSVRYCVWCH